MFIWSDSVAFTNMKSVTVYGGLTGELAIKECNLTFASDLSCFCGKVILFLALLIVKNGIQ